MTRPPLGAKVRVKAVAQRVAPTKLKRKWTSWPIPVVEGMYIGYRFKQTAKLYLLVLVKLLMVNMMTGRLILLAIQHKRSG